MRKLQKTHTARKVKSRVQHKNNWQKAERRAIIIERGYNRMLGLVNSVSVTEDA